MKHKLLFLFLIKAIINSTAFAQPTITSFSPTSGPVGTTVTITGTNFSTTPANNIVYFGAGKATVTAATATQLIVTVPTNATYQPIAVTTNYLIAYSQLYFNITFGSGITFNSNTFSPKVDSSVGTYPRGIAVSDLDGDGKSDIVTTNVSANTISVLKNTGSLGTLSFLKNVDYNAGNGPNNVTVADLDGDNKPDVIVTNLNAGGASTLSIFRNISSIGNILLSPKIDYSTGYGSNESSISDFDGDGKMDIVVTSSNSGIISIFRNTTVSVGNISFASKIDLSFLNRSDNVFSADLDGDGKPDIATANFSSANISIIKNTTSAIGNISFASAINYNVGTNPTDIVGGDFDGDGKIDLSVSNYTSKTITILRNTSSLTSISFELGINYNTVNIPTNLSIADFDGDGKPDFVVGTNVAGVVSLFKNTSNSISNISFEPKVDYVTGTYATYSALGDFDNDGKIDMAVTNSTSHKVSILRNRIYEPIITSFSPTVGINGTVVTIQGFNFLGTTNVSFAGIAALSFTVINATTISAVVPSSAVGVVSVTNPYGTGSLGGFNYIPPPTITSISPIGGPIGTSVNIVGTNFSAVTTENTVYFGGVKASVSAATSTQLNVTIPYGTSYQATTVTVKNLTAYYTQPFNVTFNGGTSAFTTSSFATRVDSSSDPQPWKIVAADFDGDGLNDICETNFTIGTVAIYRNNGSNGIISLAPPIKYTIAQNTRSIATADIDGDGKLDIIVTNSSTDKASILKNTSSVGSISFATKVDFATTGHPEAIAVADIDGDGKPDMVVGNYSSNSFSVFRNTSAAGIISFETKIDYPTTGTTPFSLVVGDLDNDRKLDVVVANQNSDLISIFKNISSPTNISFASAIRYATGSSPVSLALLDIDVDGKQDLAVLNSTSNNISLYRNASTLGNILFSDKIDFITDPSPRGISVGDLNGDGKPDIAIVCSGTNVVTVMKNTTTGNVFSLSSGFNYITGSSSFSSPTSVCITDIDGDGKLDLGVANNASNSISLLRNQIGEILPLNLISFRTFIINELPRLYWQTANEINTSHFTVEHSIDGINFIGIGNVNAAINSNTQKSYEFNHINPVKGLNYYRLKMVDQDGLFTYSQIEKIKLDGDKKITISPNPAKDNIVIEHNIGKRSTIKLIDMLGRVLKSISVNNNTSQTILNVATLPSGVYKIIWSDGITSDSRTLVKQ